VPSPKLIWAVAAAVLATGCGATAKRSENSHQVALSAGLGSKLVFVSTRRVAPRPARCSERATATGSRTVAYSALLKQRVVARAQPRARGKVVAEVASTTPNGFPQVLGILAAHRGRTCGVDWYRVQLPILPNGSTGWVRVWTVKAFAVRSRIVVDITQRRLQLFRSGRQVMSAPVAVGASATPTPTGRYVVNERYVLPDASGPFGAAALGISAHSDALARVWVQDGPIGIHGTNEPWSIGKAASHGCIRLANPMMRRLFKLAPAGTPVVVTP
jgi:lipoprotein-anchoring transpeptidase ErfK/SrfK